MGDLIESGVGWLKDKLKAHASRQVVYRRGTIQTSVQATVGRTLLRLSDSYGQVRMVWTDRDFLIPAADLILDGNPTLPRRGDEIVETVGSETHVYVVLAPGDEPEWRWSDPYKTVLRIHTKQKE